MIRKFVFIFALCCATTIFSASKDSHKKKVSKPKGPFTKEISFKVPADVPLSIQSNKHGSTMLDSNNEYAYLGTIADEWLSVLLKTHKIQRRNAENQSHFTMQECLNNRRLLRKSIKSLQKENLKPTTGISTEEDEKTNYKTMSLMVDPNQPIVLSENGHAAPFFTTHNGQRTYVATFIDKWAFDALKVSEKDSKIKRKVETLSAALFALKSIDVEEMRKLPKPKKEVEKATEKVGNNKK